MSFLGNLDPSLLWFILAVLFLVLEVATPGFFFLFFGVGALLASGFCFFLPVAPAIQWLIFTSSSVIFLLLFRKKRRGFFNVRDKGGEDPLISELYVGREVDIIEDIAVNKPGLVELNGTNWQARTEGIELKKGSRAKILERDGLTFLVSSI